jgi:hypothetical protein
MLLESYLAIKIKKLLLLRGTSKIKAKKWIFKPRTNSIIRKNKNIRGKAILKIGRKSQFDRYKWAA